MDNNLLCCGVSVSALQGKSLFENNLSMLYTVSTSSSLQHNQTVHRIWKTKAQQESIYLHHSPQPSWKMKLFAVAHCCHGWWVSCRGFNQAVNGFPDDGWAAIVSDGMDDVSVLLNESPPTTKGMLGQVATDRLLCSLGGGILCAKASMLLQVATMLP